ncbi:MAG: helix-turn-helix domain-containing protein [Candidatus Magnetoovum sp. WYHC-5]|nr:helix-turn-helix domain-containing protein [Candidatus Magnetoovum sp. WYHC-5]
MKQEGIECKKCKKYNTCDTTCIYVDNVVDDNKGDYALSLEYNDERLTEDYKDVLNDLRAGLEKRQREINIEHIKQIRDLRLRAIATMIYAGIPVVDIATLLNKSESQIYRIIKKGKKSKR